jgi:hypothetical protein
MDRGWRWLVSDVDQIALEFMKTNRSDVSVKKP